MVKKAKTVAVLIEVKNWNWKVQEKEIELKIELKQNKAKWWKQSNFMLGSSDKTQYVINSKNYDKK